MTQFRGRSGQTLWGGARLRREIKQLHSKLQKICGDSITFATIGAALRDRKEKTNAPRIFFKIFLLPRFA